MWTVAEQTNDSKVSLLLSPWESARKFLPCESGSIYWPGNSFPVSQAVFTDQEIPFLWVAQCLLTRGQNTELSSTFYNLARNCSNLPSWHEIYTEWRPVWNSFLKAKKYGKESRWLSYLDQAAESGDQNGGMAGRWGPKTGGKCGKTWLIRC